MRITTSPFGLLSGLTCREVSSAKGLAGSVVSVTTAEALVSEGAVVGSTSPFAQPPIRIEHASINDGKNDFLMVFSHFLIFSV